MTMEEKIYALIGRSNKFTPSTREEVCAYFKERLDILGLYPLESKLPRRVIHVAGTKGKGSTCAFVESILRHHGYRTGLFTSPHLISINERFRVNGLPVEKSVLEQSFNFVYDKLETEKLNLHYFGFLTILGFHLFSRLDLDVLVLEVGMGGRLDATNIIEKPSACGVSLLDLDHTEFLGDTIEAIAGEKAAIFKDNVPAITSSGQEVGALRILEEYASRNHVTLQVAEPIELGPKFPKYQHENVGLAVELCRKVHPELDWGRVMDAINATNWPGRGQIVSRSSQVLYFLDGAHTPKSIEAALVWFRSAVVSEGRPGKNVLLFNCMHCRNPTKFLDILKAYSFDIAIFTVGTSQKPTNVARLYAHELDTSIEEDVNEKTWQHTLARLWDRRNSKQDSETVFFDQNLNDAIQFIDTRAQTSNETLNVFVVGSLLLIGDVLKLIEANLDQ